MLDISTSHRSFSDGKRTCARYDLYRMGKSGENLGCVRGQKKSNQSSGHAQLEHLLSPMYVKCISSKTYKSIKRRIGTEIEKVARRSFSDWFEQEV